MPRLAPLSVCMPLVMVLLGCNDPHAADTDAGIRELSRSRERILSLECYGPGISDEGLRALEGCNHIEGVWLRGCPNVNGATFGVFATMPRLQGVSLWGLTLVNGAFTFLSEAPLVWSLTMNGVAVPPGALRDIARAPRLGELVLWEVSGISDDDLMELTAARAPLSLIIGRCAGITASGVERLRPRLPECRVTFE